MTTAEVTVRLHDLGPATPRGAARAHARAQLRDLWGHRAGVPPDCWHRTRAGRPRSPVPGLDCSVSHDRGWVGVSLGETRIGLDAMRWRPMRPRVADWLRSLPPTVTGPDEHDDVVSWTRAEAIVKYAGGSMLQEWRETALGLPAPAIDRFIRAGGTVRSWSLDHGAVSLAHWRPCHVTLLSLPHLPLAPPDRPYADSRPMTDPLI